MITVSILINGQPIFTRSAVNVTPPGIGNDEKHTYKLDDGTIIKHVRDSGAVKLSIEMLKTIKEPKALKR